MVWRSENGEMAGYQVPDRDDFRDLLTPSKIWTAMLIYIPLTAFFIYLGTMLFAFY